MSIGLEKILKIKSKIKLEQLYNTLASLIILLIISFAFIALNRPISVQQFHAVLEISEQQNCPESQDIAILLSRQPEVSTGQYLKLMQAYHFEAARAHQLPAWTEEQS